MSDLIRTLIAAPIYAAAVLCGLAYVAGCHAYDLIRTPDADEAYYASVND